jgi:cytochrome P450
VSSTRKLTTESLSVDFDTLQLPGIELHQLMDDLRRQAPVVPVTFLGERVWLITDHAHVSAAFRDNNIFPPHTPYKIGIEPVIGETFQSMSGDRHRIFRKLATPTFRPRSVEHINSDMLTSVANELIDTFINQAEVDLISEFTERYPFVVIARLLGIPKEEEEQFHRWVMAILRFRSNPEKAIACRDELWNYLDPVIADRRKHPKEDVISQLIHHEVDDIQMTDEQVKSHVGIMFTAGSSTTHDSLGNILYALLVNNDNWQRVKSNPELRPLSIEETLRWEPAVSILPRMSHSDEAIEFGGVTIEPNNFVLFGICAANHDASVFNDPHDYQIGRNVESMMTFGPGPRMCPGMHLARKELGVTLDLLIERLPNLRLIDLESSKPCGTVFRGPQRLLCNF